MSITYEPINTLLIANRGEIACRIIRTAKKLGIRTVAVYSEADQQGLHVHMADEAIAIGGAASNESYLVIERIVAAAKQSGADAVHPGYGFLSENALFATSLEKAGIRFIGPGVQAIEVMGDKIESKKLAARAGVNTVPGHPEALDSPEQALEIGNSIGYPIMLKASAGGGGKGMRIAWNEAEVKERFSSAQNEARSAFGDDRVFAEKYIQKPRHIEIQVLADAHDNYLYLGERECSIQRRHQKVIEEAPSPFISETTRHSMGEQAVELARAVNYRSAGTVEFIVDKEQKFYFLEMNTRLQVEHPITECITGLDLVEQMIRIAEGQTLTFTQNDVHLDGWAVEARVYAEDPDRQFLPSIGRLSHYQPPQESDRVRVDTGVYEGGEISMYYDPMIAKLVTWASTRERALDAMNCALNSYVIRGVKHNIAFLAAIINHPEFRAGNLTTGFIDEHYPEGFNSENNSVASSHLELLAAAMAQHNTERQNRSISGQLYRPNQNPLKHSLVAVSRRQYRSLTIEELPDGLAMEMGGDTSSKTASNLGGKSAMADAGKCWHMQSNWLPGQLIMEGQLDGAAFVVQIDQSGNSWRVTRNGAITEVMIMRSDIAPLHKLMLDKVPPDLSGYLLSPMPGLLVSVSVSLGESVKAGQELAVVEAMKMENILLAERDAVVKALPVGSGSSLAVDDVIIEFE